MQDLTNKPKLLFGILVKFIKFLYFENTSVQNGFLVSGTLALVLNTDSGQDSRSCYTFERTSWDNRTLTQIWKDLFVWYFQNNVVLYH